MEFEREIETHNTRVSEREAAEILRRIELSIVWPTPTAAFTSVRCLPFFVSSALGKTPVSVKKCDWGLMWVHGSRSCCLPLRCTPSRRQCMRLTRQGYIPESLRDILTEAPHVSLRTTPHRLQVRPPVGLCDKRPRVSVSLCLCVCVSV